MSNPFDLTGVSPVALRDFLNRATNTLEPCLWPDWLRDLVNATDKALGEYVAPFNARAGITQTPAGDKTAVEREAKWREAYIARAGLLTDSADLAAPAVEPVSVVVECEHDFRFQSVVYWLGAPRSFGEPRVRGYADRFYCRKCLDTRLQNERVVGDDSQPALSGTLPL